MQNSLFDNDICERKHGGNDASRDANERAQPTKRNYQAAVFKFIALARTATLKEISRAFNKPVNELSGRISELKAANLIEPTGDRREHSTVYRVARGN